MLSQGRSCAAENAGRTARSNVNSCLRTTESAKVPVGRLSAFVQRSSAPDYRGNDPRLICARSPRREGTDCPMTRLALITRAPKGSGAMRRLFVAGSGDRAHGAAKQRSVAGARNAGAADPRAGAWTSSI